MTQYHKSIKDDKNNKKLKENIIDCCELRRNTVQIKIITDGKEKQPYS